MNNAKLGGCANRTEPAPSRVPEVSLTLDQLEDFISNLAERVDSLDNKLSPCMLPKPKDPGTATPEARMTTLAQRIQNSADNVRDISHNVGSMIDSLEI